MIPLIAVLLLLAPHAEAKPPPILECPNSNVHVWDRDQCARLTPPGARTGGGGSGGLLGAVGSLIGL
jgi:hypothetical protein